MAMEDELAEAMAAALIGGELAISTAQHLGTLIETMAEALVRSNDGLGHLNCPEFNPLAELTAAAGFTRLAIELVLNHARGDDDLDDEHRDLYQLIQRGDNASAWARAQALVAAMPA